MLHSGPSYGFALITRTHVLFQAKRRNLNGEPEAHHRESQDPTTPGSGPGFPRVQPGSGPDFPAENPHRGRTIRAAGSCGAAVPAADPQLTAAARA